MRIVTRLAIAVVIALLLPFPGPHVDRYVPVGAALFSRDAASADAGFFVMTAVILAVYAGVIFALSLLVRRRRA